MKRTLPPVLTVALLLTTTHRLPAPFTEVPEATPTPKPRREAATAKSKPKSEATPKPRATLNRSFTGTWTGSTDNNASYVVKISDDEKTVLVSWRLQGETTSGPYYQAACIRFGSALSWSLKQIGETPTWICTDTLQLNSNGTANFVHAGSWIAGDYEGNSFNSTGTLSREGAAPASSGPQTTATPAPQATINAAAKNDGALPVAKSVPAKPGFVYNPFDPNSRFLLDVRGKASGTKLIEPKSGKLFIVP
jgi:hypothetical protein